MRGRWLVAQCGLFLSVGAVLAQSPASPQPPSSSQPPSLPYSPPRPPERVPPVAPLQPRTLPPSLTASPKNGGNPIAKPQEIPLPQKENLIPIKAQDISLKRVAGGTWQLWMGQKMLREFGAGDAAEANAHDAARVFRDIRPTEWGVIGSPRPVVEYGLVNGRPPIAPGVGGAGSDAQGVVFAGGGGSGPLVSGAGAKAIIPIDLKTVRVEAVRGVWCLRDDATIHFNFGTNRADADQALAVIHRYGFNRIGVVGSPTPVMNYLFASSDNAPAPNAGPLAQAALQAQIDALTRVGIPVAGVGYVGEMFRFDPRRLEIRKDNGEWQIVWGTELIGRFGPSEFAARDALRAIQESSFNEFCTVGSSGLTFFLVNGKAPTRVPYHVQGRRFDPGALKVAKYGAAWAVTENNHHLLDCASAEEGEILIRVLKHFQFDQLCHLGPSPRVGVSFFAKGK
jgi:hypothetical protein